MKAKLIMACAFSMALAACAAVGQAAYGPADKDGFGYQDTRIEQDRYRIVYRGSGGMTPDEVEDYALRRAAELTLQEGYDWFRVAGRDMTGEQKGGVSLGAGVGGSSYGRRTGVGVGVGGNLGTVGAKNYFTARLEILMGSDEAPDEPAVYDARSVLNSVGAE